jgi:hypothetical protein
LRRVSPAARAMETFPLIGRSGSAAAPANGDNQSHGETRPTQSRWLGVDVAHFESGLDDHRFPVFADDHEQQGRSANRLREMRDAGFKVMPGHDPEILCPGTVTA